MKKLFFAVTVSLLALCSCGGSSENKGADNVDSKAEANQIIAYTNDVIDYLNGSGDWMRSNERAINDMTKFMETKKGRLVGLFLSPNVSFNMKSDKLKVTTPPAVMSEEEKALFKDNMTTYKDTYTSMVAKCNELYKYIKNEDYKDDGFASGKALADSIKIQHEYLSTTKSMLYDKIDVVSERAENIILQDHALREPIMSLKGELKNFTDLYDAFFAYSEGSMTPEQVDEAYQKVAASVEKNKASYTSLLEENKVKSSYDSFYKRCDDALAEYRKALRDVKAKKRISDNTFRYFSSNYNSMIGSYNSFVK